MSCIGERIVFMYFYINSMRLSGWFGASDDPVHGL